METVKIRVVTRIYFKLLKLCSIYKSTKPNTIYIVPLCRKIQRRSCRSVTVIKQKGRSKRWVCKCFLNLKRVSEMQTLADKLFHTIRESDVCTWDEECMGYKHLFLSLNDMGMGGRFRPFDSWVCRYKRQSSIFCCSPKSSFFQAHPHWNTAHDKFVWMTSFWIQCIPCFLQYDQNFPIYQLSQLVAMS